MWKSLMKKGSNRKELLNAYGSTIDKKIKVLGIKDQFKAFSSDLVMEIFTKLD